MIITKCLIACDLNEIYLDFYPIVRKYWKEIVGIDTVLILISDKIPDNMKEYENEIILFNPIPNIHTAFQAQCIRILYPSLLSFNIIISDMDLIPLNRKYYIDNIRNIENNDSFIIYRDVISEYKQYPICFCLANSKIWEDIFDIHNENDIIERLKLWYKMYDNYQISSAYSLSWACDQLQLFEYVNNWKHQDKIIKLKDEDTKFNRLDRMDIQHIENDLDKYKLLILSDLYSDFHLPRPLNQFNISKIL